MKKMNVMDGVVERRRRWARGAVASALAATLALTGCTGGTYDSGEDPARTESSSGQAAGATAITDGAVDWDALIDIDGMDFEYTDRDKDASYDAASATTIALTGSGATVTGEGAQADGSTVTITAAGTYIVSGELADGSLVVNVSDQDKVQVVLDGAIIRHGDGAAFEVQQADKVFLTLADGSQNTLADGMAYTLAEGEDEPNAALFSKDDLTINGTGALTIEGNYRHGVNSKDDLVITGGVITVTAVEDGLRGKDCVKIADGAFAVTAGGDGVKSSNDEDPTRGFVAIDGGTFALDVQDDGIQAATYLRIAGGEGAIRAADHALRSEVEAAMTGGEFTVEAGGKGMNPETRFTMDGGTLNVTGCEEGIEAEKVIINDGELSIVASDDGINAAVAERSDESVDAANATEGDAASDSGTDAQAPDGAGGGAPDAAQGGQPEPPAGADGQMPEMPGSDERSEMPEGFDGRGGERPERPEGFGTEGVPDGEMPGGEMPDADGRPELPEGMEEGQMPQHPEGAEDFGGRGGMGGPGGGAGGPMGANASEDCLIQVNGGTVTIQAGGDAVDSNGYIEVTGGTLLGTNSGNGDSALDYEYGATITGGTVLLAGSAGMAESFTEGTQPFALVMAQGAAGSEMTVADAAGAALIEYTAPAAFQCVVISAPQLAEGDAGTVTVDGAATEFTASTTPTSSGMGGRGGAPGSEGSDDRSSRSDGGPRGAQDASQGQAASHGNVEAAGPSAELSA